MWDLCCRVFKKSSPNGKITVYLGKRDFVDHISHVDPIDGVVLVDPDFVGDQKVFGHVLAAFRYGREDLDVLGLTFRKDLYLASEQIYPPPAQDSGDPPPRPPFPAPGETSSRSWDPMPTPSTLSFRPTVQPQLPSSLPPGTQASPKTSLTSAIAVRLAIRKIMYAPSRQGEQPSVEVSKEFMMSPNKLHLEASLDKELYHHGEDIGRECACGQQFQPHSETNQGGSPAVCRHLPLLHSSVQMHSGRGGTVTRGVQWDQASPSPRCSTCDPLLANNKDKRGLALDGQLKHDDTNLASSTM
ncbi:ARRB1 [Cordylochernes scorpioides]|uniref:ARRB1 n=1 Tax=Cordylochernes scorpioides TaxID=51811 RepID=A0ABY6KAT9_9ARAC|nr:ARRB1 [Cordylochernes scorpioides]